jgi:hypothetical protein
LKENLLLSLENGKILAGVLFLYAAGLRMKEGSKWINGIPHLYLLWGIIFERI